MPEPQRADRWLADLGGPEILAPTPTPIGYRMAGLNCSQAPVDLDGGDFCPFKRGAEWCQIAGTA